MGEIDEAFVQALEHRPKPKPIVAGGIPLIDLSPLSSNDDPTLCKGLIKEIGDACANWGFFQVINHGVPSHIQQGMEMAARNFFALPREEKLKVGRDEDNPLGFYDTEHTKNVRDWKEVYDFTVENPTLLYASHLPDDDKVEELRNQWPEYPSDFRVSCEEYVGALKKLSYKLLELISISLGLPAKRLNDYFKDQTSFVRLNHYPPCPSPDLALGVGRHKDAIVLTILSQDDVGGLEVKRKSDGQWVRIKPIPSSYIINLGDIFQVWSNDKYESAEHRVVVNSRRERFSIPYFLCPSHYAMVKPLEELVNKQNPAKYREYSWGKFFKTRKLSNFKKLDVENIQIYHFKITD